MTPDTAGNEQPIKRKNPWKREPTFKPETPAKPADAWLQPAKDALLPSGELRRVQDSLIVTAQMMNGDAQVQDLLVQKVQEIRALQEKLAAEYQRYAIQETGIDPTQKVEANDFYKFYVNTQNRLPPQLDLGQGVLPPAEPNGQLRNVRLNERAVTTLLRQAGVLNSQEKIVDRMRQAQAATQSRTEGPMMLDLNANNGMHFVVRTETSSPNPQDTDPVGLRLEFGLADKNPNAAQLLFDTATKVS